MRRLIHCLLLFALMAFLPQFAMARNYVLSVGLNNYPRNVGVLMVSTNDAKAFKEVFQHNAQSSVMLLTDSDATSSAVLQALKYTFAMAKKDDTAIFFFSGHGTESGLLCIDKTLPTDQVLEIMRQCKAGTKVIIADACYSGKMRSDTTWQKAFAGENVILFLSSRTDETSMETVVDNSLFTIYLKRGLYGEADVNQDLTITAKELFDFVHEGVVRDSRETQHPVMWGRFDGNVPIIKWKKSPRVNNKKPRKKNDTIDN